MRFSAFLISSCVLLLLLSACNNDDVKPTVVDDNDPPPDALYSDIEVKGYVTKCYIAAYGRKPDDTEADQHVAQLQNDGMSLKARDVFLEPLLNNAEHKTLLYDRLVADMLNNADSVAMQQQIDAFEQLLTLPEYEPFRPLIEDELDRMVLLQNADEDFAAGSIDFKTLEKRIIFNRLYDDVNMGTLNFVVSVFEHLLERQPTEDELERGISMVDGNQEVIFLQDGASKNDFMDILLSSNDYHAETVRRQFQRHLFRDPSPDELVALSEAYKDTDDFFALERAIMRKTEFVNR
ncbi:MAG: hypothetical protein ACOCZ8_02885 [Bacteroidota bacterium]